MTSDENQFDVIVVGGGIVGATAACALGAQNFRVALIEAHPPEEIHADAPYDQRVSAITRASEQIFRAVGAWNTMRAIRVSPFREMRVWDESGSGAIHFDSAEIGEECLGYIIENRVMQSALWAAIARQPGVAVFSGATPSRLVVEPARATLTLADGRMLYGALIVGSDGRASWVREHGGIEISATDYEQKALVANVVTALPHRDTAWQRFTPNGPVALLPLVNGHSSLVWSLPSEIADAMLKLTDAEFLAELQRAFGDALGALVAIDRRLAIPLQRSHARTYVRPRIALIGDAAHTVHPMAGQGVNLGLLDAAALVDVLGDARSARRDLGAFHVLRRYERWRSGHNHAMQTVIDGLKRLFANSHPGVIWARNVGLRITDRASAVKNIISLYAVGRRGDLPALARNTDVPASMEIRYARQRTSTDDARTETRNLL